MKIFNHKAALQQMQSYSHDFLEYGWPIPANNNRPNNPGISLISHETGIPRWVLADVTSPARELLDKVVKEVGVEPATPEMLDFDNYICIKAGHELLVSHFRREAEKRGEYLKPQLAKVDTFVAQLRAFGDGGDLTPVAECMEGLRDSIDRGNQRDAEATTEMLDLLDKLIEEDGGNAVLPDTLPERLSRVIARCGLSIAAVARQCDVPQGTLSHWVDGSKNTRSLFPPGLVPY